MISKRSSLLISLPSPSTLQWLLTEFIPYRFRDRIDCAIAFVAVAVVLLQLYCDRGCCGCLLRLLFCWADPWRAFSMLSAVSMAGAARDGVIVVIVGGGGAKAEVERFSSSAQHQASSSSSRLFVRGERSLAVVCRWCSVAGS